MRKKEFLYLQLFADDPGSGDEGGPDPEDKPGGAGGSEPHEDDPEPEKKYTDAEVNELIKRKKAEWEKIYRIFFKSSGLIRIVNCGSLDGIGESSLCCLFGIIITSIFYKKSILTTK